MERKPWYKKLTTLFQPKPKKQSVTLRMPHEYPLPPPTQVRATVLRGRRGRYRHPVIKQELSTDPRFNHALRRMMRKQ